MARGPLLAVALMLALFHPSAADAQRIQASGTTQSYPQLGLRVGYNFGQKLGSLGAQLRLPFSGRLDLLPSGDIFRGKTVTNWQLNGDLALRLGQSRQLYAGTGVGAVRRSGRGTKAGLNLFFGVAPPPTSRRHANTQPYLEFRWTLVDGDRPFHLLLGFNYRLGRRQ